MSLATSQCTLKCSHKNPQRDSKPNKHPSRQLHEQIIHLRTIISKSPFATIAPPLHKHYTLSHSTTIGRVFRPQSSRPEYPSASPHPHLSCPSIPRVPTHEYRNFTLATSVWRCLTVPTHAVKQGKASRTYRRVCCGMFHVGQGCAG